MKILHIENDYDFSIYLKENLEVFGFEVTHYMDSTEALNFLRKNPDYFDLIICDGDPGLVSGATVVSEIRDITMRTPVLAQTDVPEYIRKMFNNGAVGAVPRKLSEGDFVKLQAVIREMILRFKI